MSNCFSLGSYFVYELVWVMINEPPSCNMAFHAIASPLHVITSATATVEALHATRMLCPGLLIVNKTHVKCK